MLVYVHGWMHMYIDDIKLEINLLLLLLSRSLGRNQHIKIQNHFQKYLTMFQRHKVNRSPCPLMFGKIQENTHHTLQHQLVQFDLEHKHRNDKHLFCQEEPSFFFYQFRTLNTKYFQFQMFVHENTAHMLFLLNSMKKYRLDMICTVYYLCCFEIVPEHTKDN